MNVGTDNARSAEAASSYTRTYRLDEEGRAPLDPAWLPVGTTPIVGCMAHWPDALEITVYLYDDESSTMPEAPDTHFGIEKFDSGGWANLIVEIFGPRQGQRDRHVARFVRQDRESITLDVSLHVPAPPRPTKRRARRR
jgi:hypothetical protein